MVGNTTQRDATGFKSVQLFFLEYQFTYDTQVAIEKPIVDFLIYAISDYIYKCAAVLIACGIDPSRTILYQQSQVPQHGQLAWIFGTKITMPALGRMHQFKFKSDGLAEVPLGLYTYPVLQAADILLYKATHVPVGEDQLQHIELCRDIAAKFNNAYNVDFFPSPASIASTIQRERII